jgi:hypothetical protein
MTNSERSATIAAAARQVLLPDILVVEDVARAIHAGPSRVREMLRTGLIPAKKLGRRWLVTRVELLRALTPTSVTPRFQLLDEERREG